MAGNTFGQLFRITNWGESHGKAIGVVVDGCPSLLSLSEEDIQSELNRRRPGQSILTTQRKEKDQVEILSGVFQGKTTGHPISMIIQNTDYRKEDYDDMNKAYRPSHADFTFDKKYGIRDPHGGGRSSARLTAGHVAAGAIAKKILREEYGIEIIGYVKSVHDITAAVDPSSVTLEQVEANAVRCPDKKTAAQMEALITEIKSDGDSVGGVVGCIVKSVPLGLGDPLFDKLEADLAKAMLSINASKGFEIGSGFSGTTLKGSEHNDLFVEKQGRVQTKTNFSGGVQGGISNGMPITFSVAFKPTATILQDQQTVDTQGKSTTLKAKGRHDPCVLPRAVPIVEAMTALVLCDHALRLKAIGGSYDE